MCYNEHGSDLPEETLRKSDAAATILLGACGWPEIRKDDGTEIAPQIELREHFDLFAGVRPIRAIPGVPLPLADPRAPPTSPTRCWSESSPLQPRQTRRRGGVDDGIDVDADGLVEVRQIR